MVTTENPREDRLAGARRRSGVRQDTLAAELGIGREAVGWIELGKITVDERFEARWMDALEHIAVEAGAGAGGG